MGDELKGKRVELGYCSYTRLSDELLAEMDEGQLNVLYGSITAVEKSLDLEAISARNYREAVHDALIEAKKRNKDHEFTPDRDVHTCRNWYSDAPGASHLMGQRHFTSGF